MMSQMMSVKFAINVSTELEMTSDARQKRRERSLRQTLQVRVTSDTQHNLFSLLIGTNDVVRYDVT